MAALHGSSIKGMNGLKSIPVELPVLLKMSISFMVKMPVALQRLMEQRVLQQPGMT